MKYFLRQRCADSRPRSKSRPPLRNHRPPPPHQRSLRQRDLYRKRRRTNRQTHHLVPHRQAQQPIQIRPKRRSHLSPPYEGKTARRSNGIHLMFEMIFFRVTGLRPLIGSEDIRPQLQVDSPSLLRGVLTALWAKSRKIKLNHNVAGLADCFCLLFTFV